MRNPDSTEGGHAQATPEVVPDSPRLLEQMAQQHLNELSAVEKEIVEEIVGEVQQNQVLHQDKASKFNSPSDLQSNAETYMAVPEPQGVASALLDVVEDFTEGVARKAVALAAAGVPDSAKRSDAFDNGLVQMSAMIENRDIKPRKKWDLMNVLDTVELLPEGSFGSDSEQAALDEIKRTVAVLRERNLRKVLENLKAKNERKGLVEAALDDIVEANAISDEQQILEDDVKLEYEAKTPPSLKRKRPFLSRLNNPDVLKLKKNLRLYFMEDELKFAANVEKRLVD